VLPDTGAASGDYINEETAEWLRMNGCTMQTCSGEICSGIGDQMCTTCKGQFNVEIILANDLIKDSLKFKVLVKVVKSQYPIILGRHTIKKNKISLRCFKYFTGMTSVEALLEHVKVPTFGVTSYTPIANAIADRTHLAEVVAVRCGEDESLRKRSYSHPNPMKSTSIPKNKM